MKMNSFGLPVVTIAALLTLGFVFKSAGIQPSTSSGVLRSMSDTRQLQDSISTLRQEVNSLHNSMPGLGEYMTSIQLHMAKLWYAGKASNWRLMDYEEGEVAEAMECASNASDTAGIQNVNVHGVLESLEHSVVPPIKESIGKHDQTSFLKSYKILLSTCNDCHRAADHSFIRITIPESAPVSNQNWKDVSEGN